MLKCIYTLQPFKKKDIQQKSVATVSFFCPLKMSKTWYFYSFLSSLHYQLRDHPQAILHSQLALTVFWTERQISE